MTTIAATATSHYAHSHAVGALSGPALAHGFQVAFYTLIGLALAGRGARRGVRRAQADERLRRRSRPTSQAALEPAA